MVLIASHELNRELDTYLAGKRQSGWRKYFAKKPQVPKPRERPKELPPEDLTPEEMERLHAMEVEIKNVEKAEREHPEMQGELEEVKESLWTRFFNLFRGYERRHEEERLAMKAEELENEELNLDQDVKTVLKAIHHWLDKLPKEEKLEFKKSNDFVAYKRLLEKYGVARKRDITHSSEQGVQNAVGSGHEDPMAGYRELKPKK